MTSLDTDAVNQYLERIGLDAADIRSAEPDIELLSRLQAAHVRHVPFETLSIVGNPFEDELGEGVTLSVDHLYEKIVEHQRGGYCFELNGLFTVLLQSLGFEAHRAAAMVLHEEEAKIPANHHTVIVTLDREYVADPGLGRPQMVKPVPLDGNATAEDAAGVSWRVSETDRRDCGFVMETRTSNQEWTSRYVFNTTPRDLSYFDATNDYFSSAPESKWLNIVVVRQKTEDGFQELRKDSFTRLDEDERSEREVSEDEWFDLLEREFGMTVF